MSATAAAILEGPPPPRSDVSPSPSEGAWSLAAGPEVRRVGGAVRAGGGRAERDADADLPELRPKDVGPVAGRAHPRVVDLAGRGEVAGAPRDVLAVRPAVVADVADATAQIAVLEHARAHHVVRVALRGAAQLLVRPQLGQALRGALLVVEAQHRGADLLEVALGGDELRVGAGQRRGGGGEREGERGGDGDAEGQTGHLPLPSARPP